MIAGLRGSSAPRIPKWSQAEAGQTLSEVLVVLLILGVVVGGLAIVFSSALKSETDQNARAQSQQQARLALSSLSRELHCSGGMLTSTTSLITVTLPSYCPSARSTTLSADTPIPSGGLSNAPLTVASTQGFSTGQNTLSLSGSPAPIVCTAAPTATTFTGCTGGTTGSYLSGTTLSGAVTWCVDGTRLRRFVGSVTSGGSCPSSGGSVRAASLIGSTPFTYNRLVAPTVTATSGGLLDPGSYYYEVTAVVTLNGSTVEIPGTVSSKLVVSSGDTSLTAHITWGAYSGAGSLQGYNVYGRDNGSSSPRLTPVPEPPQGLRKLNTSLISSPLLFDDNGSVDTAGVTASPPLATLSVKLLLGSTSNGTQKRYELDDDIVFRNSGRF